MQLGSWSVGVRVRVRVRVEVGKRACGVVDYDDLRVDAGKWAGV